MNTQEIFEKIELLLADAKSEHTKPAKAAHGRARKILGGIKKLVSEYQKASVSEDKQK
jgi:hypothetical protein